MTAAQYMKKLREKRRKNGLCARCGHKIEKPGYKTCQDCRDYQKKYKQNHKPPKKEKVIIRRLKNWEVTNKKLYNALINQKITIAELAELIDVTPRSVQRWLFEKGKPSPENREKIKEVLR